jgi:antitoxin (DNA-binding transcriptional repressor) of toxin-antitoxin stability system
MDASQVLAMATINMFEAKSNLSRLVDDIEQGREREIIIARNGKPAARLVAMDEAPAPLRIGAAKGQFEVPECIDAHNDIVARLFQDGHA